MREKPPSLYIDSDSPASKELFKKAGTFRPAPTVLCFARICVVVTETGLGKHTVGLADFFNFFIVYF